MGTIVKFPEPERLNANEQRYIDLRLLGSAIIGALPIPLDRSVHHDDDILYLELAIGHVLSGDLLEPDEVLSRVVAQLKSYVDVTWSQGTDAVLLPCQAVDAASYLGAS